MPDLRFEHLAFGKFATQGSKLQMTRVDAEQGQRDGLFERFEWNPDEIVLHDCRHGDVATVRILGGELPYAMVATPRDPAKLRNWRNLKEGERLFAPQPENLRLHFLCPAFGLLHGPWDDQGPGWLLGARTSADDGYPQFDCFIRPCQPGTGTEPWAKFVAATGTITPEAIEEASFEAREADLENLAKRLQPVWTSSIQAIFARAGLGLRADLERRLAELRRIDDGDIPQALQRMYEAQQAVAVTVFARHRHSVFNPFYLETAALLAARCEARAKSAAASESACWLAMAGWWRTIADQPMTYSAWLGRIEWTRDAHGDLLAMPRLDARARLAKFDHWLYRYMPDVDKGFAIALGRIAAMTLAAEIRAAEKPTALDFESWMKTHDDVARGLSDHASQASVAELAGAIWTRAETEVRRAIADGHKATAIGTWNLCKRLGSAPAEPDASRSLAEVLAKAKPDAAFRSQLGLERFGELVGGRSPGEPAGSAKEPGATDFAATSQRFCAELIAQTLPVIARDDPRFSQFAWLDAADEFFAMIELAKIGKLHPGTYENLVDALAAVGRRSTRFSLSPGHDQDRTKVTLSSDSTQLEWSTGPSEAEVVATHDRQFQEIQKRMDALQRRLATTADDVELEFIRSSMDSEVRRFQDLRRSFDGAVVKLGAKQVETNRRDWQEIEGSFLVGFRLDEGEARRVFGHAFRIHVKNLRQKAHKPTATPKVDQWMKPEELLRECSQNFAENLAKYSGAVIAAGFVANAEQLVETCADANEKWWLRRLMLEGKLATAKGLPIRLP